VPCSGFLIATLLFNGIPSFVPSLPFCPGSFFLSLSLFRSLHTCRVNPIRCQQGYFPRTFWFPTNLFSRLELTRLSLSLFLNPLSLFLQCQNKALFVFSPSVTVVCSDTLVSIRSFVSLSVFLGLFSPSIHDFYLTHFSFFFPLQVPVRVLFSFDTPRTSSRMSTCPPSGMFFSSFKSDLYFIFCLTVYFFIFPTTLCLTLRHSTPLYNTESTSASRR